MLPGRGEAFIALVAGISLVAVMLGVAALVIVMSVMNGFRAELLDKIVGLNGHAIIQAYGGRLENWENVLKEVRETPGVVRASPLIEQPLMITFNGRADAVAVRGQTQHDIGRFEAQKIAGNLAALQSILADGVTIRSDGGGRVHAFPNAIVGLWRALRLYGGLFRKYGQVEEMVRPIWIDGLPGYVSLHNGTLQTTALQIEDGLITGVYMTRNPDKLGHIPAAIVH